MLHIIAQLHGIFADKRRRLFAIAIAVIALGFWLWGLMLSDIPLPFVQQFAAVIIPFGGSRATSTTPFPHHSLNTWR